MSDLILPSCSILLLAGGRGQRMGGHDKGLIDWHGRPLIAWLHETVRPLTDDLLLSCNRNQSCYAKYADRLVCDAEEGYPGPLAGIRSGLSVARNDWMLLLPCDTPLVDQPLLQSLHAAATDAPEVPVMLRCGKQSEPLFSIIPTYLRAEIETLWLAGERSPLRTLLHLGVMELQAPDADPRLANLNSPELLKTDLLAGTSQRHASSHGYRNPQKE
ncbi:molybdenum cofactor guanylyltransferase MobA [Pseudomonas stutzeri]|uniref:Molybdenum cofactor guanylyltransferase n=1 Tax=Stutzerimonas stutzeri TaxID=316 RepID=A0A2N8S7T1_STUST|nr:molybdenum cofactor guanylyltransferase MobA [Stutzerimonas stutzeri]MCQ4295008.1 molybdenum cofactor guanylyltransferase MobA [Stutzerimonas stutzeri]PNF82686.1 molybdenum cofactor guanylyltransferase MobA [Stutzerimonas stutzeri]